MSAPTRTSVLPSLDPERIRDLRGRGEFFWLALVAPTDGDLDALADLLPVHSLALEDSREFGQRAKLDDYADSALIVVHAAQPGPDGRPHLVEVHLHLSRYALVTVTSEPVAALDDARGRLETPGPAAAVHAVLDAVADSVLRALDGFDDEIDDLQAAVADHPTRERRRDIFALRARLAELRHVVVPQRDLLAPGTGLPDAVAGLDLTDARHVLRDVHDHLDRAVGLITTYRERLAGVLDLYLTEISMRQNEVMQRLTVIATVFLPLSFLVGFFGMNFGWMSEVITPQWTFWVFGMGLMGVSVAATVVYLRRTGADRD